MFYLASKLIAPLVVRGGKNSKEKNVSLFSYRRIIFSLSGIYRWLGNAGD